MKVNTFAYTDRGGRENNEDSFEYYFEAEKGVWVLADGLGGHACGEEASQLAVQVFAEQAIQKNMLRAEQLPELLKNTNDSILDCQKREPEKKGMCTTLVGAVCSDGLFSYIHAGDSRLYYFRDGKIISHSKDHSVSRVAVEMGEIKEEEIRFHDDRNKLLKVLGEKEKLNITKADGKIEMQTGDAFLLCSDGFWEYVYETEMLIDLLKSETPKKWLTFMTKRLLLRISGNHDNFTAICGFITEN